MSIVRISTLPQTSCASILNFEVETLINESEGAPMKTKKMLIKSMHFTVVTVESANAELRLRQEHMMSSPLLGKNFETKFKVEQI